MMVPLLLNVAFVTEEELSVSVRVRKDVAELEPDGPGTREVMVVVIV